MSVFHCLVCQRMHDADYDGYFTVAGAQMCEEKYDEYCREFEEFNNEQELKYGS